MFLPYFFFVLCEFCCWTRALNIKEVTCWSRGTFNPKRSKKCFSIAYSKKIGIFQHSQMKNWNTAKVWEVVVLIDLKLWKICLSIIIFWIFVENNFFRFEYLYVCIFVHYDRAPRMEQQFGKINDNVFW